MRVTSLRLRGLTAAWAALMVFAARWGLLMVRNLRVLIAATAMAGFSHLGASAAMLSNEQPVPAAVVSEVRRALAVGNVSGPFPLATGSA